MLNFRKDFLNTLFQENDKLNAIGITLYVDAMLLEKTNLLFNEIYQAGQNNTASLRQILSIYEARKKDFVKEKHPFFDVQLIEILSQEKIFRPYFIYENELDTVLMSDDAFQLLLPLPNEIAKNSILFLWQGGLESVELIVENNKLEMQFKGTINNNFALDLSETQFAEGLYYYKIIYQETLIRLGKFYVIRQL